MTCSEAIELMDRFIFEETPMDAGLREHLDTCPACSKAYIDALKAREMMASIRRSEPRLRDPDELTDSIMSAIREWPENQTIKSGKLIAINLQRFLAAASIALFLLFGYEQYGVVKKITALQKKIYETSADSPYSDPQVLASKIDINRAGISFSELERLIPMLNGKKQAIKKDKK